MKIVYFSEEYIDDIESYKLINELNEKMQEEEGIIYYKFPTVKEFDKPPITPDIFIVSESIGVFSIVVDTISISRDSDKEYLNEKIECIDNYIYTTLLKNRDLKANARSLIFDVETVGYCPNLLEKTDRIYTTANSLLQRINEIAEESEKIDQKIIDSIIGSLEASAAIIKPKERILEDDKETKAKLLKGIETQVARFDDEQRFSALSLLEGPQRIRGLAGSGKTIILCLKAANLHMKYPDAKILYTFYTKSLYDYIVQLITRFYMKLTDGQVPDFNKVCVLHAWGGYQVPGVYYEACKDNGITPLNYSETKGHGNAFSYICKKYVNDTQNVSKKEYDYVLIDEAQDFEAPFYQLCRSIVKDDHLIWCYDEVQNIFDVVIQNSKETFSNQFDREGIELSAIQIQHPQIQNDIVLHKSYRNVKKILLVAVALGFGIYNERLVQSLENNSHWEDLGFKVISGDCSKEEEVVIERREDASPLLIDDSKLKDCICYYQAPDYKAELLWIANEIEKAIKEEKLLPVDIAVICIDQKNSKSYMENLERLLADRDIGTYNVLDRNYVKGFSRDDKVTLSSVFKAKGNEAAMVFVCGCDVFEYHKDERKMRNMIFTAFTRAKVWLRISGVGENSLSQMLKEMNALKENGFRFKFMNKPTHLLDKDWSKIDNQNQKENEIRQSILEESKRLGVSVDQYLMMLTNFEEEKEKKLDE